MFHGLNYTPSVRAQIITRRTYNRPTNQEGTQFETWEQTVDRNIEHQRWLWETVLGDSLLPSQKEELEELRYLMINRAALLAGRTLWLGGTEIVKRRSASMYNCSYLDVRTVHDLVDIFWLLLQGCGTGFTPMVGNLSGFVRRMEVSIVRSTRTEKGGRDTNLETYDPETRTWTIQIGDSAEAWAKSIGKIVAGKYPAKKLVLDFSQIRPAGVRLRGYGWICCGDQALSAAYQVIANIMNLRAGKLLTKIDILDIVNWLGTVLSNRRSAQIALCDYGSDEWSTFASAKSGKYWDKQPQRAQSNNTCVFQEPPSRKQLKDYFDLIVSSGGSEPGLANGQEMRRRAPWAKGLNPCGEILLSSGGLCNLVTIALPRFHDNTTELRRAARIIARANYRQTCVNLRDGILQDTWHQNNEFLRLCGVSLLGIVQCPEVTPYDLRNLRYAAIAGAYSMADELGLERPKNVTTVKPEGTASKITDCTDGCHKPMAKYLFNNVSFNKYDAQVAKLAAAGYRVFDHPLDPDARVVVFPVSWDSLTFNKVNGMELNLETAVTQLERYKMLMKYWCDQNVSCTVSYDKSELPAIIDWFTRNWDDYVGVSFLFRADPSKTAEDLGYPYLPQEPITKEQYETYVSKLQPVTIEECGAEIDAGSECAGGVCPVR